MATTPRWIPIFFGAVMILMALIILGALLGVIPAEGEFLAPPIVIASIGICLLFGGIAFLVPERTPSLVKSGIFFLALMSLALVCNWTAFAPDASYSSSTTIGPFQIRGGDQMGGRIVFGAFAILVDLLLLSVIIGWIRPGKGKET
jgi:hypothetical protein